MDKESLELLGARVFGLQKGYSWMDSILASPSYSFAKVNGKTEFAAALQTDLQASDKSIASFIVKDAATDITYKVWFNNPLKLWEAEIADSPEADILPEEYSDLMTSELVKSCIAKAYEQIKKAADVLEAYVMPAMESGQLLEADEVLAERLISYKKSEVFMDRLKSGRYTTV